jgi:tol-pal system protein YbgF
MEVADIRDRARLGGGGGGGSSQMEIENLKTSVQRLNENVETASVGGMSIRQQMEYISARLDRLEKRANLQPLSRDVVASPPIPVVMPTAPPAAPAYPPQDEGFGPPPPVASGPQSPVVPPTGDPGYPAGPEPVPVPGPAPVPGAPPGAAGSPYDEGKELFDQKNYSAAIERFKAYMSAESGGAQVPAAQFYIGESLYFQNQFDEAILAYQDLISGYPKNAFVSTALLKQGLSFQAIGDKSSARLIYQKVVREYPKSYAAGVARERLKTI